MSTEGDAFFAVFASALDAEEHARAGAEGRSMTIEEQIAYALD